MGVYPILLFLILLSPMTQKDPFKWKHYEKEIILLCVRWYLRYSLSCDFWHILSYEAEIYLTASGTSKEM
jgi:hypothetical protein